MQRDNYEAVRQAAAVYRHADKSDSAWRIDAVRTLSNHGLWSLTQIVAISSVPMRDVRTIVSKSDHTGGRFSPASLPLIVQEFELRSRGESNDALTARIVAEGTSAGMLARLLDVNVSTIRSQVSRAARQEQS